MKRTLSILSLSLVMFLLSCGTGQVFLKHEKYTPPTNTEAVHQNFTYEVEPYHKIWGTLIWITMVLVVCVWAWLEFRGDRVHAKGYANKNK